MTRVALQVLAVLLLCAALLVGSAYAVDLSARVPDAALGGLLRILVGMLGVLLAPLILATTAYLLGWFTTGRSALLLGVVAAASSVGGIALALSAYPLPWDETVATPGWVWEKLEATQEAWVSEPEEAFWNVLEPPLPAPDRMWVRPDTSVDKDRLNDPDFVWASRIYVGYPGGFIRTAVVFPGADHPARPYFASLRAPSERYLSIRQRGDILELTVSVSPRWNFTPEQTRGSLDVGGTTLDATTIRRDDAGLTFVFTDVAAPSARQFVVIAKEGERRILLRFEEVVFGALTDARGER